MATTMEIVTFNCQGLRSSDYRETLFSWLHCTNVDFLCLQETHSVSQREFSSWLHDAVEAKVLSKPYDCVSSPGANRSSGVAIVYKSHFELSTCATDQKGRFDCGHFSTETNSFQICTIHGPNTSKEGGPFFDSLYPVLDLGYLVSFAVISIQWLMPLRTGEVVMHFPYMLIIGLTRCLP